MTAGSPAHITELSPDPVIEQGSNNKFGVLLLVSRIYTVKCLTYSAVNKMKDREDWAGATQGSLAPGKPILEGELTGHRK